MGIQRTHYDLIIVGTGSGNSIPDARFDDKSIAIVEEGRFGGTCLNVGCIPTKMFVYPAEVIAQAQDATRLGVTFADPTVDLAEIQRRVFAAKIDPIAAGGEAYRRGDETPNIDVYGGHAHFVGERTLEVNGTEITADQIVLAAGSRPVIPAQIAASPVTVRTNKDIMRLDKLPEHLVIVGAGYIAMEFAHVFSRLGCRVTVLARSAAALRHLDDELVERFNRAARAQWDMRYGVEVAELAYDANGKIQLTLSDASVLSADEVLVATGRVSNADRLNAAAGGLELAEGRLKVDAYGRCVGPGASGVWALGDVSNPVMLKHAANAQARVIQHNLLYPDQPRPLLTAPVPAAVFTHPQIASVGLTEREARAQGLEIVTAVQEIGDVAYGWAMDEKLGVVKLVADKATSVLIGAHILGPDAATLIQPLVTAMSFGIAMDSFARGQYWIHPALTEAVENAALKLCEG